MKTIDELEDAAQSGTISKEEIFYVAQLLKNFRAGVDSNDLLITWIFILGSTEGTEFRGLVEPYICYRNDTLVCCRALKTICERWRLTEEHLDIIEMYIRGAVWDDADEIRIVALLIAGNYLRKKSNLALLQLLMDFFEGFGTTSTFYEVSDDKRDFLKGVAYEALSRAVGEDWDDIYDGEEIVNLIVSGEINASDLPVIQKASQMLKKHKR